VEKHHRLPDWTECISRDLGEQQTTELMMKVHTAASRRSQRERLKTRQHLELRWLSAYEAVA